MVLMDNVVDENTEDGNIFIDIMNKNNQRINRWHYNTTYFPKIEETKMTKVNYNVLANSMVLNFDGKTYPINKGDVRYPTILQAIRDNKLEDIPNLVEISNSYKTQGLELKNNQFWLDNESLPEALSDRVLAFQKDQLPFEHLIKFARKLRKNPSYNSRLQLFKFLEHNGHPITTEGNFIAYRGIREDFKDMHTGTFNNRPGQVCEMKREYVDDNPNNTCSRGLHVACFDYAKGFGQKLVEVEVDPQDVVCVPIDYNGTKMRTCKFKVVTEAVKLNENQLVNSSYEKENNQSDDDWSKEALCDDDEKETDEKIYKVNLRQSRLIASAEYDIDIQYLTVQFCNGNEYTYKEVPYQVVADWEMEVSTGAYFNMYIVNNYVLI